MLPQDVPSDCRVPMAVQRLYDRSVDHRWGSDADHVGVTLAHADGLRGLTPRCPFRLYSPVFSQHKSN